jgi:PAS domain S-box-containing protein
MNILIVDDNTTNLKLMRAQLEAEDHVVAQAQDGVEALALLDRQCVDVVISDILMPRMDGYRLCHEIRKRDRLAGLPTIIYSSTFTSPEDVKMALDVGADKYLSKPASVEIILAALHEVMAKPHAAPDAGVLAEVEVLKEYSQRLVGKLADKNHALELANAKLSATRDQLAHLLKHSPAVLYSLAMEGERMIPQLISENITRLLGFTVAESCTCDWWANHLHPEDRERVMAGVPEAIKGGAWNIEYRIRHKAGHYLWVEDKQRRVRVAEGRPVEFVGVWTDITERKHAATELLESRRFLRSTLDALSSHIAILDERGTIVEVNAAWDRFAREHQFGGEHGVGDNYLKVCDSVSGDFPSTASPVAAGIRAVMAGQQTEFHLEYPCHSSQERRWFVVRATRFAGDGPVRVVVAHENITERKLAGDALRESDEKFRQIAETAHEVFRITDATMHQMVYVSPAYEKIWGRTCQSLYESPRTWLDATHPEDRERVVIAATTGLPKGEYNEIYRIVRPDGSLRWIHDRAVPLRHPTGEIYRYVGTAADITENRKLEDACRQAQKMESIGQLAGGIAHDFNNILTAIVGNLDLARMVAAGQPAVLDSLENISQASHRAAELVKQILTFSRQARPERGTVRLNDVVIEALKLLRSSLPATIRIETTLTETPVVLANATAIHQAIMNLGTNAWHAMRHQTGVLKVEMCVLELDVNFVETHPDLRPGSYVQLSVSDTGCGMSPATLLHVFEPFFTTKAVSEGTGLGLAVVHGIMKSHDGGIYVYSQPGKGTMFHLYFPVIETEVTGREIEATPVPRGHGEHILFLDDEEVLARVGKRMLERLGYIVTTKTDPLEAIAALRDQPETFDLVITDLTMPGMDGVKLGSQLLQMQPNLPIIIMSGYSGVLTDGKARALGFRELLSKPCSVQALAETVHRALSATTTTKT